MATRDSDAAATNAVLAHCALNGLATMMGAAATLHDHWMALTDAERVLLLETIEGHAALLAPTLRRIAQGLRLASSEECA
jgi:hypothetical protein